MTQIFSYLIIMIMTTDLAISINLTQTLKLKRVQHGVVVTCIYKKLHQNCQFCAHKLERGSWTIFLCG